VTYLNEADFEVKAIAGYAATDPQFNQDPTHLYVWIPLPTAVNINFDH
jgi:hypothetical protein